MIYEKTTTVAFTGHRIERILQDCTEPIIRNYLLAAIRELYHQGYRTFISGMATGFDLWAADIVVLLKSAEEYSDIQLVAAVPCPNQDSQYNFTCRLLYNDLLIKATEVVQISPVKNQYCYLIRNDWMLDRCSHVICFYDGGRGGTGYTVNKAAKMGIAITNLFDCK